MLGLLSTHSLRLKHFSRLLVGLAEMAFQGVCCDTNRLMEVMCTHDGREANETERHKGRHAAGLSDRPWQKRAAKEGTDTQVKHTGTELARIAPAFQGA